MKRLWMVALLGIIVAAPASAQREGQIEASASDLVVNVLGFRPDSGEPENGSGFVVAAINRVVIVTAAHVIRHSQNGGSVRGIFRFAKQDTVTLTIDRVDESFDLAILSVESRLVRGERFSLDRQGNEGDLLTGDPVYPAGCPDGVCWSPAVTPDRFVSLRAADLTFQSFVLSPGNSGGPLFNRFGEVVAMVTEKADPLGHAIPIAVITDRLRQLGYKSVLHRRAIPREGYNARLSLTGLTSSTSNLAADGRLPSARASLALRGTRSLGWHISALRLAPTNIAVTGGMVGLDLRLQTGRAAFTPFVEIGLARVEGRTDLGGIVVQGQGGPQYLPVWKHKQDDVIGTGGGGSLELQLLPHIALETVAGYWHFSTPSGLADLPDLFAGAGLRFGF